MAHTCSSDVVSPFSAVIAVAAGSCRKNQRVLIQPLERFQRNGQATAAMAPYAMGKQGKAMGKTMVTCSRNRMMSRWPCRQSQHSTAQHTHTTHLSNTEHPCE